jgi:hypothetical protein
MRLRACRSLYGCGSAAQQNVLRRSHSALLSQSLEESNHPPLKDRLPRRVRGALL